MKSYYVNGKEIFVKPHIFEGKLSKEEYEKQIFNALSKIGVFKDFVDVRYEKEEVEVMWKINSNSFVFKCCSQSSLELNLGAIAQAIQEDVRQITRGIKDLNQTMSQYATFSKKAKGTNLLNFDSEENEGMVDSEEAFKVERIDDIVDEELEKKYEYLLKYNEQKLDVMYFRLKEQCSLQNMPNHPMFKALKIVRQKKGLKL